MLLVPANNIHPVARIQSPLRLSAIRIIDAHALDLVQWEEAARRISQSMHSRAENG